jgi:type II secretory pathway pseudopilin PulG
MYRFYRICRGKERKTAEGGEMLEIKTTMLVVLVVLLVMGALLIGHLTKTPEDVRVRKELDACQEELETAIKELELQKKRIIPRPNILLYIYDMDLECLLILSTKDLNWFERKKISTNPEAWGHKFKTTNGETISIPDSDRILLIPSIYHIAMMDRQAYPKITKYEDYLKLKEKK